MERNVHLQQQQNYEPKYIVLNYLICFIGMHLFLRFFFLCFAQLYQQNENILKISYLLI